MKPAKLFNLSLALAMATLPVLGCGEPVPKKPDAAPAKSVKPPGPPRNTTDK